MIDTRIETCEARFAPSHDGRAAAAGGGMVATAFPEATDVGVRILEEGGNAVDAAVAAAFALGVCEPQASGLGGQSSAILYIGGKVMTLDGSSRLPSLAHRDALGRKAPSKGHRAATVPSTPAFLGYLHFRHGALPWDRVVEPAIRVARDGYAVTALQAELQERELANFEKEPSGSGSRYFLRAGKPYAEGARFVQKDLAELLDTIASEGFKVFYTGKVAKAIDRDMRDHGGFLRKEDLAFIPWPVERRRIRRRYRGVQVHTVPPPGAGRTLLLVLMVLARVHAKVIRKREPIYYHLLAESLRKALLTRQDRPFDPATYPQFQRPTLKRTFAREMAHSIREAIDPSLPMVEPPGEPEDTTHLSVMDGEGNAVGLTQSIERVYGAKAAADGLGFLYNNYVLAYEWDEPSHPYYVRPGSTPWSSVAPSLVFLKDRLWMVMGSPGSDRIFSTLAQFLMHTVDAGMSIDEAMRFPRLHCSPGGRVSLEDRFGPEVPPYLEGLGYTVERREPYAFHHGAVHAVVKCSTRDGFQGVAEVRRDGTARGID